MLGVRLAQVLQAAFPRGLVLQAVLDELQALGFRGKTGTVERIRPDGSHDVRPDDPSMVVKRIPATKLSAASS